MDRMDDMDGMDDMDTMDEMDDMDDVDTTPNSSDRLSFTFLLCFKKRKLCFSLLYMKSHHNRGAFHP